MRFMFVAASVFLFAGAALAQPSPVPVTPRVETVTCRVGDVAVFDNRVHVRCAGGTGGVPSITESLQNAQGQITGASQGGRVPYYAVALQSAPANSVLNLASHAAAQNRQVQILYHAEAGSNPPGCHPSDCRRLIGIIMVVQN